MASIKSIIFIFLSLLCSLARGFPNQTVIYIICSDTSFDPGDPYGSSVANVVSDAVLQTQANGYDYYNFFSEPNSVVAYGHGACNGALSNLDCEVCLNTAARRLQGECDYKVGGQAQLQDCRIRFENYSFTE